MVWSQNTLVAFRDSVSTHTHVFDRQIKIIVPSHDYHEPFSNVIDHLYDKISNNDYYILEYGIDTIENTTNDSIHSEMDTRIDTVNDTRTHVMSPKKYNGSITNIFSNLHIFKINRVTIDTIVGVSNK